jgi:hypothetical protein
MLGRQGLIAALLRDKSGQAQGEDAHVKNDSIFRSLSNNQINPQIERKEVYHISLAFWIVIL